MIKKVVLIVGFLVFFTLLFFDIKSIYKKDVEFNGYINNGAVINIKYIKIDRLGIKNIIMPYSEENLNNNYVVIKNDKKNNTILAGHAISCVFLNLYFIKENDKVIIYIDNLKEYLVEKKYVIDIRDFKEFEFENKVVLLTCLTNNNKRLIVVLKKL